jgi:Peptidase A4 family
MTDQRRAPRVDSSVPRPYRYLGHVPLSPRLTALLVLVGSLALPAASAAATTSPATSSNWSGYAVSGPRFRHVSATWVQPAVTCTPGDSSYSAMWVGIGGNSDTSQALEQVGTEANCSRSGVASADAWYELVPAGMVHVRVPVHPGDTISASVTVNGHAVRVHLVNDTTHRQFTRTLRMRRPDITSAEWIVEAPSVCDSLGNCVVLPLADFGSVPFAAASATTLRGHTGSVTDAAFTATPINLVVDGRHFGRPSLSASQSAAGAVVGPLSPDGSAFSVAFSALSAATGPTGGTGPPGPPGPPPSAAVRSVPRA